MTLEFYSTKNQHRASSFLFLFCIFYPKLCYFVVVPEAECSGRGISLSSLCRETKSWGRLKKHTTFDYFFLVVGIEEEHIRPWMVSQLIGWLYLTDLASGVTVTLVFHNTCFSGPPTNSQNQGK